MADVITRSTYLEISSTPLATPAWRILDLSRLYGLAKRGADRVLPGAAGARPYERIVSSRTVGLPIVVFGAQDREGTPHTTIWDGLDDNVDALMAAIVEPVGSGDGTRPAVWHRASGNVTADVHVVGLEPAEWGQGWVRFTLDLTIPAGRFGAP